MIVLAVVLALLTLAAFGALTVGLARTIRPIDEPCAEYCQYARDVAMDPYYSCAHGCVYLQMGRR